MNQASKIISIVAMAVLCAACKPENPSPPQPAATATDYPPAKSGPVTRLGEEVSDRDKIQVREIISPSGVFCILVNNGSNGLSMQCDFKGEIIRKLK